MTLHSLFLRPLVTNVKSGTQARMHGQDFWLWSTPPPPITPSRIACTPVYVLFVFFDDFCLRLLGVTRLACGTLVDLVSFLCVGSFLRLNLDVIYLDFWFVSLFWSFFRLGHFKKMSWFEIFFFLIFLKKSLTC